jgi:putative heme-binding domain-containing protein
MNSSRPTVLIVLCALGAVALVASAQNNAGQAAAPSTAPAARGGRGAGRGPAAPADVSADNIQTLYGFKVEVVLKADPPRHGSWISMAKDSQGRLLLAGQANQPVTRLTLDGTTIAKEEIIRLPVSEIMGMVEVGDALYVNGRGPGDGRGRDDARGQDDGRGPGDGRGSRAGGRGRGPANNVYGLYRLRDPNGDLSYSSVEFLREWPRGSGEHGAHALHLSPDGKYLYSQNGNQVPQPPDIDPNSPLRNYADDRAIPRQEDTFMANEKPPGGSLIRMDLDGKNPVAFAGGERNTYDMAFNADGEVLAFDSDMEWDWGLPWYRPTRVYHAVAGADYGYRGGSGKYPVYYEDSLPPVVNIGLGSPTGVVFGYGSKFPAKYQKALYIMDWTYGRLMAVHLKPHGASYEATWENFIAPKSLHSARKVPLNVTDMVIGNDGAMYFTIGGRNTQGCLYRVTYTGAESTAPADLHDAEGAEARALRQKLESFNGKHDDAAVPTAWPYMSSDDRFLRFAARLAIESQPIEQWKSKALNEANPQAAIEALLALTRLDAKASGTEILKSLARFPLSMLNDDLQLQKLRVLEILISRNQPLAAGQAEMVVGELDPYYPSYSPPLNNELSQILLALDAPRALGRTIKLLQSASTQEEQVAYLMYMRHIKTGWTPELRREYFAWFNADHSGARHYDALPRWFDEAGRAYANGNSFNGFVSRIRTEAVATLAPGEAESTELAAIMAAYRPPAARGRGGAPATAPATAPTAAAGGNQHAINTASDAAMAAPAARTFVRDWTMADLEPSLDEVSSGRNYQSAQAAYAAAQCSACHAMAGTPAAGGVGPDLTSIAARFRRRDILESIIEPSKVISEQFADHALILKNGDVVVGRIIEDGDEKVVVQTNPRAPDKTEVKKADIASRSLSKLSPMPTALVNILSKDEILDLIAYMEAAGRPDHPDFAK